jgi:hypothetical protein
MNLLFDSFWRAVAYCLHPRVVLLSLAPLLLMTGLAFGLAYFFWEPAMDTVQAWPAFATVRGWLDDVGLSSLRAGLAPLVVVLLSTPVIVLVSLLLVAALMTPAIVKLVSVRRFPRLEMRRGGSMLSGALFALGATLLALLALLVSIPLWLVPPLVLIVPPLIWGWLTYRVLSYDVLADHASRDERREVMRRHRPPLLFMGVVTGYLGAAPSLVWVSGAMAVVLAPVLIPLAIWIYTLVFAFSSLWFAHFALAALQVLRIERDPLSRSDVPAVEVVDALPPAALPPA